MFTPIETTVGALMVYQATSNLLHQNGNILGASGFLRRLFSEPTRELLGFFVGMAFSYIPMRTLAPDLMTNYPPVPITLQTSLVTLGTAALVGWGSKMSNGCTSAHMLCGLSRLSGRSAIAVATFFPVALITHHLVHPTLYTEACPGNVPCYTPVYPSPNTAVRLILLAALTSLTARIVPGYVAKDRSPRSTNNTKQQPTEALLVARVATSFFSGLLFALGLHISQMSHPAKVASFLSFPVWKHWDPSLALLMLFGVLPGLFENRLLGFDAPPKFADNFSLPTKNFQDVDMKFIAGAATFGVGWGLTGTCPGPAVLRACYQPLWGALWIGGFLLGGRVSST